MTKSLLRVYLFCAISLSVVTAGLAEPATPGVFLAARQEIMSVYLGQIEKSKAIDDSFNLAQNLVVDDQFPPKPESKFVDLERFIHPYTEVSVARDDNIFLTNERQSDTITTIIPGLKFSNIKREDSWEKDFFEVDLGAKIAFLANHKSLDYQKPYASILLNKYLGRNFLTISEVFTTDVLVKSGFIAGDEGFIDTKTNLFNFGIKREFNRLGAEFGFARRDYFYTSDFKVEDNYNENIFSATGFFKITPKTNILSEYDFGMLKYPKKPDPSRNGIYNQFWFGLRGQIAPKVTGVAKAGYQFRSYKAGSTWEKPILSVDLTYRPKERIYFFLGMQQTAAQSYNLNENYYKLSRIDLGAMNFFAFNPKLSFRVNGFFENDEYPPDLSGKRKDKIYSLSSVLKYDFKKWLYASLEYRFKEDDSNFDANDYVDHALTFKIRGDF